jgi:hypothetical protein
MSRPTNLLFLLILGAILSACASSPPPQLIASYPKSTPYGVPPASAMVIYNSTLTLSVNDMDRAINRANHIAYEYNGYLISSHSWYQEGNKYQTIELAIPSDRFEAARQAALSLGHLIDERVSGNLYKSNSPTDLPLFSHITLELQPATPHPFPGISINNWDPGQTLARALKVTATLFSFALDALIWVGVVGGPFFLAGWLILALIRRVHKS